MYLFICFKNFFRTYFVDDYFYALPQFEFAEAMVRDPNCDGNYELFLRLVDELPSGVEFDSIKIEIGDDFKATIAKSSLNQTGATYTTPLNLSSFNTTDFRGELQAWVTMPGEEQSSSNRVLDDGVPPKFTEVGIVESFETDPATRIDTLKLGFSEGVIIPSSNVLLDFFNSNKELQTHSMEFVDLYAVDEESRVWNLLVRNNTVVPVDNVSEFYALINDGNITDISRNSISDCSLDTLAIQFLPQPVPIELANIVDYTEDGAADSIHIRFVRKLRPIDIPDSLEVEWGYPNSITYYYPSTAWKFINSDSTELVVNLTDEYKMPHGMTAGTQGNGNGLFTSRVGSELIGTRSEKILQDKVGPVVATATYTPSGFLDRLIINYSEPLDTVSTGEVLLKTKKRGRSTVEGDFTNFISQDWLGEAGDPLYRSSFVYDTTVTSYVTLLDSARMPFEDTPLADLSGNKAGKNNQFVVIKGQSRTPDYNLDVSYVQRLNNITPSQLDEMKEIYTTESSYKDRFILSIGDVNETDRWIVGGGQGRIPIEPESNPINYSTFGPTLKIVVNDIPTIGGFDANGFPRDGNVDSIKIQLSLSFVIYDHLGQFVNQVSTPTFTIDNPNWINASNQIVFYLEWLPDPTKGGPRSADGRIVGTGGYIGQLDFNMKLRDDSPAIEGVSKERDGKKTWEGKSFFGFKRFKK